MYWGKVTEVRTVRDEGYIVVVRVRGTAVTPVCGDRMRLADDEEDEGNAREEVERLRGEIARRDSLFAEAGMPPGVDDRQCHKTADIVEAWEQYLWGRIIEKKQGILDQFEEPESAARDYDEARDYKPMPPKSSRSVVCYDRDHDPGPKLERLQEQVRELEEENAELRAQIGHITKGTREALESAKPYIMDVDGWIRMCKALKSIHALMGTAPGDTPATYDNAPDQFEEPEEEEGTVESAYRAGQESIVERLRGWVQELQEEKAALDAQVGSLLEMNGDLRAQKHELEEENKRLRARVRELEETKERHTRKGDDDED